MKPRFFSRVGLSSGLAARRWRQANRPKNTAPTTRLATGRAVQPLVEPSIKPNISPNIVSASRPAALYWYPSPTCPPVASNGISGNRVVRLGVSGASRFMENKP